ncbi:MAG: PQQ-like beta-propeller repeat protein [Verrucomicrobiales bacterium]|nr:PQQ-like beta-propeller repeat protein [Verrucomicrobiales bacterium]
MASVAPSVEAVAPEGAADFLRFMGPAGDGRVGEVKGLFDWKNHPPVEQWRVEVGEGWSGFVVHGDRAVTQEQRGELECVTCYELSSGKLLWLASNEGRFDEAMGGIGPRATPVIDPEAGMVYTLGALGLLQCLDLADGSLRWKTNVLEVAGTSNLEWGKSAAPLLDQGRVIVSGGRGTPTLLAFDAKEGRELWRSGEEGATYSSPVLRELAGEMQIVSVNQGSVTGHDRDSGAVKWRFEWSGDFPKVCQPEPAGANRLLITSSYGVDSHLIEITRGESGKWEAKSLWASGRLRTKFSSASVVGDHAYALDEGRLVCVDLNNGERVWREGRYGYGQHLLCGKDTLLIQSEPGEVAVVRAQPEGWLELGRIEALHFKTWNPPCLAGRWLLVRNDREAIAFLMAE